MICHPLGPWEYRFFWNKGTVGMVLVNRQLHGSEAGGGNE